VTLSGGRRAATLPVGFFGQDAVSVARGLLGALLVTRFRGARTAGRIVEVEAYLGADDPASHAFRYRRHAQNESLYLEPGTWYVYRSYGMHWCANLVAGPPGQGAAVLLRAIEPVEGLDTMKRRRGLDDVARLGAGPGRLCEALGITRTRLDGRQMTESAARIVAGPSLGPEAIASTVRIGISKAAEWPLRFVLRGSPWASGRRAGHLRPQKEAGASPKTHPGEESR
jgi:DNA-3-methyladenine glycosylase